MKALVLSGGKGTRLRPITHTCAKQLLPVGNKPILFFGLEAIAAAGIKDVGIVVGETHEEIRNAVKNGSAWGLRVRYIQQEAPLGLAHAVKISRDFLGDDSFVMYLGDNLIRNPLGKLVKDFKAKKANAQILLAHVPDPTQFGVAQLKGGHVVSLEEKPKKPKSDLALVGVYLFDKNIFKSIARLKPSARGELEITDAISGLLKLGFKVQPTIIEGWWKDTGKLEDILEANRLVLDTFEQSLQGKVSADSKIEGKVVVEKGAKVVKSTIRGPVIIGKGAEIVGSYVGPFTAISENVKVLQSEIENSIVLKDSVIEMVQRIEGSLIGQNVQVVKSKVKPAAYKIMVGDSSRMELP